MTAADAQPFPPDDAGLSQDGSVSTGPPRTTPLREVQLVDAHRRGDPDALSELLQSYQRRVYSVCYRMVRDPDLAADLAQDSLVKLIEGLEQYDGRAKLSTWVIRITMNCCITHLRRQKFRRHASLDAARDRADEAGERSISREPEQDRELSADRRIEQEETRARLHQAMLVLDPDMRAILVLRDMQGLEYEQLAEVFDIPIGTVKSRLYRARETLRELMEHSTPLKAV